MEFWHGLPDIFRRDVVSRLDFKSRCHLRQTCHADQQLVDSCPVLLKSVALALTSRAEAEHIRVTCWNQPELKIGHKSYDDKLIINEFLAMVRHTKSEIERLEIVTYVEKNLEKMTGALEQLCRGLDEIAKTREFPIKCRSFTWHCFSECYPEETFQKILDALDPKYFESITANDEVWFDKSKELPEKAKKCRNICIISPIVFSKSLCSAHKLQVYLSELEVNYVVVLVESFLDRSPPLGSFFELSSSQRIQIPAIFQNLKIIPKDEPFDNRGRCHIQRFPMKNKENVLVLLISMFELNTTSRINAVVCRKESVEEDFKKKWE